MSIKGGSSVANLQKIRLYNPNIDLVDDNGYKNVLKILSKNQCLASIKGSNSVVNLLRMMLY